MRNGVRDDHAQLQYETRRERIGDESMCMWAEPWSRWTLNQTAQDVNGKAESCAKGHSFLVKVMVTPLRQTAPGCEWLEWKNSRKRRPR